MSNPRRDYRFFLHRDHFLRFVDPSKTRGLEIGAYDLPLVQRGEGFCDFADFNTADELKEFARSMPGHSADFVEDVKYNLRNGYDDIKPGYDWIAALHVGEHVPDLFGWLQTLQSKLKPSGIIFLVLPDKRYTYDFHRSETRFSELVDAHQRKLATPSFRHVFDHHYYTFDMIDPGIFWSGGPVPLPNKGYAGALELAERSLSEYVDAHCSVFTPTSFVELINDATSVGLISLTLQEVRSTQYGQMDFSAVLRATDLA